MRIRTIKPEWLEDERMAELSSDARVMSIALLLLADDVGRGRLGKATAARIFPTDPSRFPGALAELCGWFVLRYEVRGQHYFEIVNWTKHQRIDRPSKSLTPEPSEGTYIDTLARAREDASSPRRILDADLDLDQDLKKDRDQDREREHTRARDEHDSSQESLRIGSDFMLSATGMPWLGHDRELSLIGARAEPERLRALAAIQSDAWCQANMSRVSPRHVLRSWNRYSTGNQPMKLAKAVTSDTEMWRSRVQASTRKLDELKARRQALERSDPNYLSILYDIDKGIMEETDRLERRRRELHALTG